MKIAPEHHTILQECPLCGSTNQQPWREKKGYNVVECSDCSFRYVRENPSLEFLKNFYAPTYSASEGKDFEPAGDGFRKLKYLAFAKWISSKFPKSEAPIKTLELGCGQGDFQAAVKDNPRFNATGLDYSEACVNYAQSQGLDVKLGDIQSEGIEEETYDLVVALHVLEHVQDLNSTIDEIYRVLKPGGLVFAVCPSATHFKQAMAGENWKYLGPPGHLWYLSPQTFPKFFTKAGFSEVLLSSHFYHRAHVRVLIRK